MTLRAYDKYPIVEVFTDKECAWSGWSAVAEELSRATSEIGASFTIAIECYSGVLETEIRDALGHWFNDSVLIDTRQAFLSEHEIEQLVSPYLGGNDPIFGYRSGLEMEEFLSTKKMADVQSRLADTDRAFVIGPAAFLIAPNADVLIYADMPRWEEQKRQRRNQVSNLGVNNSSLKASLKYKRSFFVDWRVCDRLKLATLSRWDYLLDTTIPMQPKLVKGEALQRGLSHCASRPFRVVPFFEPGPWGGQWMKEMFGLDPGTENYAWCFDCVPEENSLQLRFGDVAIEIPAMDLVYAQPQALLGENVYGRFGCEFPIRFDFLDTMAGGNLSLQVHPLTEYIQDKFGMHYTQDESYYILDAKPGASVFLGRKNDTEFDNFVSALEAGQRGKGFANEPFVGRFPTKKHDHFLIPAGTLHCSGKDCVVLEISSTPYIFTFKLWDWDRLGLDGLPRPINIEHGKRNIMWDRDEDFARTYLINQVTEIASGENWREERTGLHEAEFIETRRHWFSGPVEHDTGGQRRGGVNVLNLIEGDEITVESPSGMFAPFVVHFAETFIVPAAVGAYRIRPSGPSQGGTCATIKAYVRQNS
jgi:hypothetical protein